jgi:hypothetical protein
MTREEFASHGFLAVTVAGLFFLCSGLLAIAFTSPARMLGRLFGEAPHPLMLPVRITLKSFALFGRGLVAARGCLAARGASRSRPA